MAYSTAACFVESWGIMFTTELDIRNAAVLPVSADLMRMNISYPTLKLFLNTPDEVGPMLVASSHHSLHAGYDSAQFNEFFAVTWRL